MKIKAYRLLATTSVLFCAAYFALSASSPKLDVNVDNSELARQGSNLTSYSSVIKQVTPTVVSVYTTNIETGRQGMSQQDLLERFFGVPNQGMPQPNERSGQPRRVPQGVGSGVIITSDGYILSNNHVVTGESENVADEILVRLDDNREFTAKVVGRDPKTDIAVLKIDATNLPAIVLADSDKAEVGDVVFAIGNPMGVGKTVTSGIISAVDRSIGINGDGGYESFIQTDASINPGNSGGALVDAQGRLVGINSAILSRSGGADGIGFAVSSNLATSIAQQLVEFGEVKRGFLGVTISSVTADIAEAFHLPDTNGALINSVNDNSPASKAGLKKGDVIIEVNGKSMADSNAVRLAVAQNRPGSSIQLAYIREGKRFETSAKIDELGSFASLSADELLDGVTARPLSQNDREQNRMDPGVDGLLVVNVEGDSPYARSLTPGMVISEINDKKVDDIASAKEAFHKGANKLYVHQGNQSGFEVVKIG
ncbi:MAG: Do family serine endopeptidase [Verrucomicrobiae bacterium]|nr:Do family serine endopeptidase [Verrucomicrobiae bacterium]